MKPLTAWASESLLKSGCKPRRYWGSGPLLRALMVGRSLRRGRSRNTLKSPLFPFSDNRFTRLRSAVTASLQIGSDSLAWPGLFDQPFRVSGGSLHVEENEGLHRPDRRIRHLRRQRSLGGNKPRGGARLGVAFPYGQRDARRRDR